jgi:cytochrome c-type biogenesis protein CcsB
LILNIPFGAYLASLVGFIAAYLTRKPLAQRAALVVFAAGWLAQTAGLAWRWAAAGRPPTTNMFESLLIMAWGVGLCFVVLRLKRDLKGLEAGMAFACVLVLAAASLMDTSLQPLVPALQSNWLFFHVVVVMLAYSAFAIGAAGGAYRLAAFRPGRGRSVDKDKAGAVDAFNYRALTLGFLLLAGGIILGAVWANEAWGTYWSWDPKETWSLITWLIYAAALHLWRARGWRGNRFAVLTLVGLAFVIFTYFGVNYLLSGLHSYR